MRQAVIRFEIMRTIRYLTSLFFLLSIVNSCTAKLPSSPDCKSTCMRSVCWETECEGRRAVWLPSNADGGQWECIEIVTGSSTCDAFDKHKTPSE